MLYGKGYSKTLNLKFHTLAVVGLEDACSGRYRVKGLHKQQHNLLPQIYTQEKLDAGLALGL